ncbi:MAG TPA: hypothetical protein VFZ00_12745 [Solirubrobacter sp.]|nr:hypothetical protein [Solirubrobacter sp.]
MPRRALLGGAVAALLAVMAPPAHAQTWGERPTVHSVQAVGVSTTAARLRASVTFNEGYGEWWWSYCREADCSSGQQETPHQELIFETNEEALAPTTIEWPIKDLVPSTVYRATLHAGNDTYKFDPTTRELRFTTTSPAIPASPVAASATTAPATGITPTAATLNGTVVPGTTDGTGVNSTAYFQWGDASGPLNRTTPAQQLPADANPYPITAGLGGLQSSHEYRFRLVVVRRGTYHYGPIQSFTTTWAPSCAAGTSYQTVTNGRVVAIGCFASDGSRWVADGAVRLNGVLLEPAGDAHPRSYQFSGAPGLSTFLNAGNRFYIDRDSGRLGTTGTWNMSAQHLPHMHRGVLNVSGIDWNSSRPLMSLGADRSVDLFDFPLAGELSFTPDADGSSRLGLLVSLPLPGMESVTGDVAVKVNPGGDLAFDRLRLEVGALPVPGFELGNVRFLYDRTENQWEGAAEVSLPTVSRVRVGVAVTVRNGRFSAFAGSIDGLNQHLAYGVFLQRLGVRVGVDPIHLGGDIGITAGPKVGGVGIVGLNGSFDLDTAGGDETVDMGDYKVRVVYPGSISLSGSGTIFDIPLRTVSARWYFSQFPWIEVSTSLGIDVKSGDLTVFKAMGTIGGSLYRTDLDLYGEGGVTVFDIDVAKASVVASTRGIGACGSVYGVGSIGAYKRWGERFTQIYWCDMRRLRSEVTGRVSAAAAGGERALALPSGERRALVRFTGSNGAPQVVLHGPGGRTIATPAAGEANASKRGSFVAIRDDKHGYTDVLIKNPGAGWTYETVPGSTAVKGVKTAGEAPKVRVRANVKRTGKRAVLRWKLNGLAGRRVTFMESGPGAPPRVLARTTATSGSKRFKPYVTRMRKRQIVAIVDQDGAPHTRKVVARYTAPKLGRVGKVRGLRAVRKRSGKVAVFWTRTRAAASYRVIVVQDSGRRAMRSVKTRRITAASDARSVTVIPVGLDTRPGKPATVKVKR